MKSIDLGFAAFINGLLAWDERVDYWRVTGYATVSIIVVSSSGAMPSLALKESSWL